MNTQIVEKREIVDIPAMLFINNPLETGDYEANKEQRRIINSARRAVDMYGTKNAVLVCQVLLGDNNTDNKIERIIRRGYKRNAYI